MGAPQIGLALLGLDIAGKLVAGRQANVAAAQQDAAARSRIEAEKAAQAATERRRREALRRTMASARAGFGGRGVGSADGSGAALLAGLASEADAESIEERGAHLRRVADLQRDIAYGRRINLLDRTGRFIGIARDVGTYAKSKVGKE